MSYIIVLCSFITSSYSSNVFLISKLFPSTRFCADSIEFDNILFLIDTSSLNPTLCSIIFALSVPNLTIKSSSNDTQNWLSPGSPWRPERPRNWLSIRLDSCLSVPITNNPPSSFTPSPSLISVPRPAIFVAIVTDPFSPALAIISASLAWFLAFNTSCGTFSFFNFWLISSLVSTATVPTSTGCPIACLSFISFTIALNFPSFVANNKSP